MFERKIDVENRYFPLHLICTEDLIPVWDFNDIPYSNMLRDFYPGLPDHAIAAVRDRQLPRRRYIHLHVFGNTIQAFDQICLGCPDDKDYPERRPALFLGEYFFIEK